MMQKIAEGTRQYAYLMRGGGAGGASLYCPGAEGGKPASEPRAQAKASERTPGADNRQYEFVHNVRARIPFSDVDLCAKTMHEAYV